MLFKNVRFLRIYLHAQIRKIEKRAACQIFMAITYQLINVHFPREHKGAFIMSNTF